MRRRRRIIRFITRGVATALIGAFVAFLVPTVISDLGTQPTITNTPVPESPVARQFIDAFALDDQATLTALGVPSDVRLRATRLRADFARVDLPVHLGSYLGDAGQTLHSYASHAVLGDGTETMLGWRVVTAGGQAFWIDPPSTIEQP